MFDRKRRELITLLSDATIAGMLVIGAAHAQTDFPNRHIHMVVPYPAGGIVDIATRIVTDKLSEIWHQPIVVEAKPGASGNLAWDQVSRAEPDGYTWTNLGPATMANPRMYAKLRWSEKSFVPVGATVWGPSALVVHPSLPVNTVTEFVNHVRKNPGILNLDRAALQKQALQPMEPMSADEIAELYAADAEKYAKIIREAGIKLSD